MIQGEAARKSFQSPTPTQPEHGQTRPALQPIQTQHDVSAEAYWLCFMVTTMQAWQEP